MNFRNLNLRRVTKTQLFLLFSYIICWFSISTDFNDVKIFYTSYLDLFFKNYLIFENSVPSYSHLINFCRQSLNIFIFPILLFLLAQKANSIKIKKDLFFLSFIIYFLLQIPGLIFHQASYSNFVYIMSAINILIILQLSNHYFDNKKYLFFVYISLFMLILITILNYKTFVNFIYDDSRALYTFFTSSETFFGKNSPRSTGSSRTFLLIFIISLIVFKNYFKKKDYIENMLFVSIATIILLFQSRTTFVLLIVFIILNYRYQNLVKLEDNLKYFFINIVCPVLFLIMIIFLKNLSVIQETFKEDLFGHGDTFELLKEDFQRPVDPLTYSSGRFADWNNLHDEIKKSPLIGYGSQGDRFTIEQSASNGIMYALSSSGLSGFFFFAISTIYSLVLIFKKLYLYKKIDSEDYFCSVIIFLIILRSILESSYAVFGVDFIVFSTFLFLLKKLNKKNEY